jgi:hypothetical protein
MEVVTVELARLADGVTVASMGLGELVRLGVLVG